VLCNCDGASKIGGTACAAHNGFPFMSSFNDRRSFWTSSVNTPTTLITRTRSASNAVRKLPQLSSKIVRCGTAAHHVTRLCTAVLTRKKLPQVRQ
jgi:hypothetical protein